MKLFFLCLTYVTVGSYPVFAQFSDQLLLVDTRPPEVSISVDVYMPTTNEPFFPGGQSALAEYLKQADWYPRQARMAQLDGLVRVRFRVQASGYLTDIQIVESRGPILDRAAMRCVGQMPRWFPAHQNGVAVARTVVIPVRFKMD
jgi:periplasmic protein TonB